MSSKYDQHLPAVLRWRKAGMTWEAIAAELIKLGTPADRRTARAWFLRRKNRVEKIAAEVAPFDRLAGNIAPDFPTAHPQAKAPKPAAPAAALMIDEENPLGLAGGVAGPSTMAEPATMAELMAELKAKKNAK